jgi:enoyl-CoA hydratase/carnithine racemase
MSHLSFRIDDDGVAAIVLHNGPQNRIDDQMVDELAAAIEAVGRADARALVVCAEGPDFSFGGDISTWPLDDVATLRAMFSNYLAVFNRFEQLSIPTVAAVRGLCFGGGFELALRADVIFAGETARFGHPEQTIGIITLLGGVHRVAEKAGRAFASEWAMTSEQVPAQVMSAHGVVNRVHPDDSVVDEAFAFARKLAKGPTRAYTAHKTLLSIWATGGVAAADAALVSLSLPLMEGPDAQTGITSAVKAMKEGLPRPVLTFNGR